MRRLDGRFRCLRMRRRLARHRIPEALVEQELVREAQERLGRGEGRRPLDEVIADLASCLTVRSTHSSSLLER